MKMGKKRRKLPKKNLELKKNIIRLNIARNRDKLHAFYWNSKFYSKNLINLLE